MRAALLLLISCSAAGLAQNTRPSWAEIAAMERSLDSRLQRFSIDRPIDVLGLARGIYLDGYGVVFTVEINALPTAGISPFRPSVNKEEVARVHEQKAKRLAELRPLFREMLLAAASSLDRLGPDQQIVLGVFFWSHPWEDVSGLPRLIRMQARRDALLDVALNRQPRAALDQIIRVREE